MKRQAVDEKKRNFLAALTQEIKGEYEPQMYEPDAEIKYLKKCIKILEKSISWTAHNLGRFIKPQYYNYGGK
ncbi:MAG: hypothetical protein HFH62_12590 [Lachnospiraceae bacterium]|nr:hypothetical protein [Lachnospiraceae bacterium]